MVPAQNAMFLLITVCLFAGLFTRSDAISVSHQFINTTNTPNYGYFITITGNEYAMEQITNELLTYGFVIVPNRVSFEYLGYGVIGCQYAAVSWSIYGSGHNAYNAIPIQNIVQTHLCDWRWINTPSAWVIIALIIVISLFFIGFSIYLIVVRIRERRNIYQVVN